MTNWFDEEEIMKSYIASERYEVLCDTARNLIRKNKMSLDEIADVTGLTEQTVKNLEKEVMELA
jgi:predicted transcriptional regulator